MCFVFVRLFLLKTPRSLVLRFVEIRRSKICNIRRHGKSIGAHHDVTVVRNIVCRAEEYVEAGFARYEVHFIVDRLCEIKLFVQCTLFDER